MPFSSSYFSRCSGLHFDALNVEKPYHAPIAKHLSHQCHPAIDAPTAESRLPQPYLPANAHSVEHE